MQLNTSRVEERSDERGSPIAPTNHEYYRDPSLRSGLFYEPGILPQRDSKGLRCGARGFRLLGQLRKARRIFQGDVGEHLAVELDACSLQSVDEVAVGKAVQAGCGADTDDPDGAELALLLFASGVGELQSALHRFLRSLVEL